jgi:hypothetical protein
MVTANKRSKKIIGRPRTETLEAPQLENAIRSEGQRELARAPRKRIPFGAPRTKLAVPITPEGYRLHWVNDDAGRIYRAEQGFYEFASPEECGFDKTEDGKVKVLVGKNAQNGPMFAYLMKIKKEYDNEDKQLIDSQQDSFEAATKRGQNSNGEHGYVPKEGIKFS